jgi:hypothetical protein
MMQLDQWFLQNGVFGNYDLELADNATYGNLAVRILASGALSKRCASRPKSAEHKQ